MFLLKRQRPALLVLEDGSVHPGFAFAGEGDALGEVVFNTGMTGYQEILTDPSYKAQVVTMTYPLIGNTGINDEDMESAGIFLEGFIVREYQDSPSNWRSRGTLKAFLESRGKIGVEGIDTRALTRRLRLHGAMRGMLTTRTADIPALLEQVRTWPGLVGRDLIREVTCAEPYRWADGRPSPFSGTAPHPPFGNENGTSGRNDSLSAAQRAQTEGPLHPRCLPALAPAVTTDGPPSPLSGLPHLFPPPAAGTVGTSGPFRVVVVDCGVKYNMLRLLEQRGCDILVLPATATDDDILSLRPDGVLFSNGPGDPAALPYIVEAARGVLGKAPLFGICLGHQILGQALGATTGKLKFGHHGINQPVKNSLSGRIEITSQNHGFHVLARTLPEGAGRSHTNLNDGTSEGLDCPDLKAFSVQYHPEAAPGPNDAVYLFDRFVDLMAQNRTVPPACPKRRSPPTPKKRKKACS